MKQRLLIETKKLVLLLLLGFAYLVFVNLTKLYIPCLFHLVTGLDCPSCGITRMFVALSRLEFSAAFAYNPVIFVTLPILAVVFLVEFVRYIKSGKRELSRFSKVIVYAEIVILVVYGIIRNIG